MDCPGATPACSGGAKQNAAPTLVSGTGRRATTERAERITSGGNDSGSGCGRNRVCTRARRKPSVERGPSRDPRCARTRGRPRVRAYGSQRPPARPRPLEVHQDRTRRQVSRSCVGYSKPVVKRRLATVKSTLGVSYSSGAGVSASPSLARARRPPAGRSIASLLRRSPRPG